MVVGVVSGLSSCTGKVSYATWAGAERAARDLRRRKSAHAAPYSCGCGSFHVGNTVGPAHLGGKLRRQKLNRIIEREAWA